MRTGLLLQRRPSRHRVPKTARRSNLRLLSGLSGRLDLPCFLGLDLVHRGREFELEEGELARTHEGEGVAHAVANSSPCSGSNFVECRVKRKGIEELLLNFRGLLPLRGSRLRADSREAGVQL
jgi:hypothetical protein